MKSVRKKIDYIPKSGVAVVTLYTSVGTFHGTSSFNDELDKGEPSEWIGCSIAEDRAMIYYTKERIRLKRAEIKGLQRFIKSYYKDPKTQAKAKNLLQAMNKELEDLLEEREEYCKNIKAAIKSRETYNRLKNVDRKARANQVQAIQQGIAALKSTSSNKDKTD